MLSSPSFSAVIRLCETARVRLYRIKRAFYNLIAMWLFEHTPRFPFEVAF